MITGVLTLPKWQSCLYGKATKRPWRTTGQSGTLKEVILASRPMCFSGQLELPVAAFVGQNKGFFFCKRYKVVTILVDHFSRLSYVYLQESTKRVQTLAAKRSFEAYPSSYGVKVQQYHANNGRFAEHLFLNHGEKSGQKVSLCGVSAHFQNGIAERRIKDLTERSRTSLLHAIHGWPSAVTINLWPYALRSINEVYNATPALRTGKSPLEAFSQTAIRPKVLDFHPPFCPVYVLHNGLQGGGSRPNKWVGRSRVAINLGQSPRHARSVALVLSLLTGYVSPQFHLKHDDFFETVRDVNAMPQSKWQELANFTPEEMTGKPLLPAAAKDHKRQVRLELDHTPFNHDITEDSISIQGGHDDHQMPLQQPGRRLDETIRHPPSGRPPGSPFNQGEQPYLLDLPHDQGERPFLQNSSWSKSMQCMMTQTQWKITSSRGRLKTPSLLLPLDLIQIPCTTMLP
jgi:hypothetical protein